MLSSLTMSTPNSLVARLVKNRRETEAAYCDRACPKDPSRLGGCLIRSRSEISDASCFQIRLSLFIDLQVKIYVLSEMGDGCTSWCRYVSILGNIQYSVLPNYFAPVCINASRYPAKIGLRPHIRTGTRFSKVYLIYCYIVMHVLRSDVGHRP
jgi:hypothetical protein